MSDIAGLMSVFGLIYGRSLDKAWFGLIVDRVWFGGLDSECIRLRGCIYFMGMVYEIGLIRMNELPRPEDYNPYDTMLM